MPQPDKRRYRQRPHYDLGPKEDFSEPTISSPEFSRKYEQPSTKDRNYYYHHSEYRNSRQPEKNYNQTRSNHPRKEINRPDKEGRDIDERKHSSNRHADRTLRTVDSISQSEANPIEHANMLTDLFFSADFDHLIEFLDFEIVFTLLDQTGKIPYAGIFLGKSRLLTFFQSYNRYVRHQSGFRGESYANHDRSRIIVTLDLIQSNSLIPLSKNSSKDPLSKNTEEEFALKLFFVYTFNQRNIVNRIDISFETGPLSIFYSSPLSSKNPSKDPLSEANDEIVNTDLDQTQTDS
jgi:hypothetical protein